MPGKMPCQRTSLHRVDGRHELEACSRPTAAGWWLFRIPKLAGFDWEPVEVVDDNGVLCAPIVEGWGMNRGANWFGEWAGPLTPTVPPIDLKLSDSGAWRGSCEGGAKKETTDVRQRSARTRRLRT